MFNVQTDKGVAGIQDEYTYISKKSSLVCIWEVNIAF